jgi:short-subunit dehydrogenase
MNLILGGTHGLGREIALALQVNGEATYVVGRSYSADIDGEGEVLDLSDAEAVKPFAKSVGGMQLKGFYWVAGYGYNGDFAKQTDAERMVAVNFANVMPIAQKIWQQMQTSDKSTRFVVVSSTTGTKARAEEAVYAATKHAQVGFARSLGLESERLKSKVKVSLFLPGGMRTPFWKGKEPTGYESYLDPKKVAARIVSQVRDQSTFFQEDLIVRGAL